MSISPLIPAAGAAGLFAAKAAKSLVGGMSFADVFRKADAAQPAPAQAVGTQTPLPSAAGSDPQKLLSEFQDLLARKLSAAGIDLSQPIGLTVSGEDGVQVNSENPDWVKIEQLVSGDSELRSAFNRLADAFTQSAGIDRRQFQFTLSGGQALTSVE